MAAVALREPGRTSNVPVQVNVTGGAASTDWQKKAVLAAPGPWPDSDRATRRLKLPNPNLKY